MGARSRRGACGAVVAAGPAATVASADGDPASDVLLLQNVYFPYRLPSAAVRAALQHAADAVYARGDRVRVALIFTMDDLGSIPSMFGQPSDYAHFLGVELGLWYVGPLLVVMPAGFGIWDGGRSTAAEERVLRTVPVSSASPDELARSATAALQRLTAADALRSADVTAPLVTAYPAFGTRGRAAVLRFDVFDDSGRSRAHVRIYSNHTVLDTLTMSPGFAIGTRTVRLPWPVPARLPSRDLRFCVVATDPAGNRSKAACAPFLRLS